jgi:hypothetical protein
MHAVMVVAEPVVAKSLDYAAGERAGRNGAWHETKRASPPNSREAARASSAQSGRPTDGSGTRGSARQQQQQQQ